jgi:hypothetical protein
MPMPLPPRKPLPMPRNILVLLSQHVVKQRQQQQQRGSLTLRNNVALRVYLVKQRWLVLAVKNVLATNMLCSWVPARRSKTVRNNVALQVYQVKKRWLVLMVKNALATSMPCNWVPARQRPQRARHHVLSQTVLE